MENTKKISVGYTFQATWVRYKHAAGAYTAFFFATFFLSLTVGGIIGGVFSNVFAAAGALLSNVFAQLLTIGWAHYARAHFHGQTGSFDLFFKGFTQNARQMVAFGLLVGALSFGVSSLIPQEFLDVLSQFEGEEAPQSPEELFMWIDDLSDVFYGNFSQFAAVLAMSVAVGWLTFFAPYRISLAGDTLLSALNWSALKALGNAPQILAIYLLLTLMSMVALPITLFLGIVFLVPFSQLMAYDMYTQLVDDEQPEEAPEV